MESIGRDHPRVCGEKHTHLNGTFLNLGSPPRMRGKVVVPVKSSACCRITPAYAGKSYHAWYVVVVIRDHPRVCGEKVNSSAMVALTAVSPPRMRGKGCHCKITPLLAGITPAYAGKSALRLKKSRQRRDHPRVCGEKSTSTTSTHRTAGSPPRVRGKAPVWRKV